MELKLYKYVMLVAYFCGTGTALGGKISTPQNNEESSKIQKNNWKNWQLIDNIKNINYEAILLLIENNGCTLKELFDAANEALKSVNLDEYDTKVYKTLVKVIENNELESKHFDIVRMLLMFGAEISNIKKNILQVLTGNSYYCKRKDENYDVIYKYNRRSFEAKHALCDSILNGDTSEAIMKSFEKIALLDKKIINTNNLFEALQSGNVEQVKEIAKDDVFSEILHEAPGLYLDSPNIVEIFKVLINSDNVDLRVLDNAGMTLIQKYIEAGLNRYNNRRDGVCLLITLLIENGVDINVKVNFSEKSALEMVINKFFNNEIDHDDFCLLFKTLLFNNAHFDEKLRGKASQDKILKFLFDVVCNLKVRAAQGQEDVLTILIKGATCKKQTNDGRTICLSSIDLVNFSIHNNLKKALQHSIKQNELYLQGPAKVMANYQNLPLDMFECFWNLTKDKERKQLLEDAVKKNNKKFVNEVLQYNLWQQKRNEMCAYNDQECFDLNFIYAVNNPKKRIKKL